ncbi:hypothetical protein EAI_02563 [Harpegnathos saltator]|uniref:Uncharacterized protein n=1 Tax=Harpegnathos saltator TaxID=610380 RepID=E2BND0_HARSA|nr:hypothetical protein EAI_02563 [Harpegnathos saltator]
MSQALDDDDGGGGDGGGGGGGGSDDTTTATIDDDDFVIECRRISTEIRDATRRDALAYPVFSLPCLVDTVSGGSQTGSPSGP